VRALRIFGFAVLAAVVGVTVTTDPRPGLSGDGPWIALALAVLLAGIASALRPQKMSQRTRIAGLLAVTAASWTLTALQPNGAPLAGIFVVVIMGALRLPRAPALAVCGVAVGGEIVALALTVDEPGVAEVAFVTSVVPWFLVMRLVRQLEQGREQAEQLVDELRDSRAAHAEAAALAERGRLARDMHDVLAHTLSALALQLEAARLLARDRNADPEVVDAIERAHHHAAAGLDDARRAIAALRGDALPGPERLQELADAFAAASPATCRLAVAGEPRPLDADARLAIYRTAQEALTNVRRHTAAERVDVRLGYDPDGVTLVVEDHGNAAPVAPGTADGYGIAGMRERAELLGGRLEAGPVDDGFRVELWLPG
jgi:signal transduction histidine kinase